MLLTNVVVEFPGWAWVSQVSPPIVVWVGLTCLFFGAVLAAVPVTWGKTKMFATWVHEASHAVVALATGRRVSGMKVNADTSGVTQHVGRERGLGRLLTAFAGYPGPALLGLLLCYAVGSGHVNFVVVGVGVFAVLLLPIQRSLRGLGITLLVGVIIFVVLYFRGDPVVVSYGLLFVAGYLLMASPRTIVELHRVRSMVKRNASVVKKNAMVKKTGKGKNKGTGKGKIAGGEESSDADSLAMMTGVPAVVWEVVFMSLSLWAVWLSVGFLI